MSLKQFRLHGVFATLLFIFIGRGMAALIKLVFECVLQMYLVGYDNHESVKAYKLEPEPSVVIK